jgi:hypothetical protein
VIEGVDWYVELAAHRRILACFVGSCPRALSTSACPLHAHELNS